MDARYLRVKNWSSFQHYSKRRPPWIKLYNHLLDDDVFLELGEVEQWQLVRIWMFASRSSRFTLDEKQRAVPVVADDETTLRRAIRSTKRVPLSTFIRDGWLIPVAEHELVSIEEEVNAAINFSPADALLADELDTAMTDPKAGATEWRNLRRAVLERDNYTCRYCGRYRKGERVWAGGHGQRSRKKSALHIDHVIPRAKGGKDTLDNLVTACIDCNLAKYDRVDVTPLPLADSTFDSGLSASALLDTEVQRSSRSSAFVRDTIERSLREAG